MAKTGRPTKYTEEIADQICELIATTTKGLNAICSDIEISPSTVYLWLNEHQKFSERYARAREQQADLFVEQIIEIADAPLVGSKSVTKEWGEEVTTGDNVDRSKLMVDARKWAAAKLHPKKYSEKLDLNVTEIPAPIIELTMTDEAETEP